MFSKYDILSETPLSRIYQQDIHRSGKGEKKQQRYVVHAIKIDKKKRG